MINPPSSMTILDVENVHKAFGGVQALENCTFNVQKSSTTALIGPNGSGKTTMFDILSRLIKEENGSLYLNGTQRFPIHHTQDYVVARQGISRTFQHVRLFRNLTIQDHLEIALRQNDESLVRSIIRPGKVSLAQMQNALSVVGLEKPLNTYATDLSYGQRKLLDLAIAIAKPHTILLLDEPVAGINPAIRSQIKGVLRRLHEQGETILLIEHDMNFVMGLAQFIYVLDRGKIIAQGTPEQIRKDPRVLEAYLGAS